MTEPEGTSIARSRALHAAADDGPDGPDAGPTAEGGGLKGVAFDDGVEEDEDALVVVPPPRLQRWSSRRRPLADVSGVDPDGPHGHGVVEDGDCRAAHPAALACTTAWSDEEGASDDGDSDENDVGAPAPVSCVVAAAAPVGGGGGGSEQQIFAIFDGDGDDDDDVGVDEMPGRGHDRASAATNGRDDSDGDDGDDDENGLPATSPAAQHEPRVVDAASHSHSHAAASALPSRTNAAKDSTVVKSAPTAARTPLLPLRCGCLAPYARPLLCLLLLYALFITGALSYLVRRFLPVPGLSGQVDALELQNRLLRDRLDGLERQRRRLDDAIDRFHGEKVRLAFETSELAAHNVELNSSNAEYEALNGELNSTLIDLGRVRDALDSSNVEHRLRHDRLAATNDARLTVHSRLENATVRLSAEKRSMEAAIDDVRGILDAALSSHEGLSAGRDSRTEEGRRLNATVLDLRGRAAALPGENALYEELNANLTKVASFWRQVGGGSGGGVGGGDGGSGGGVDASFRGLSSLLDNSIETSTSTAVEDLHLGMERAVDGWRCHLSDTFDPDSSPFVADQTAPLGGVESYRTALRLVDEAALSGLCGDVDDFETYLAGEFPLSASSPGDLSVDQLASGLKRYSVEVIDHYFPDEGESGITEGEWADAGFDCRNLPVERRFSRSTGTP